MTPKPAKVCYLQAVSLVDVVGAAAELLDAVDERIGAADWEWVAYDHAGSEAAVFAAGCLQAAQTHPEVALLCLRHGLKLLHELAVPTARFVFQERISAELRELGVPLQVSQRLRLVA
jgi:hypothetical protein